jgi:UDPglucose 6-dehydrogenase
VSPILEEGLAELLRGGLAEGLLTFTADAGSATSDADFVFLCVPTPQAGNGAADLSFVQQAAKEIAPHLKTGAVVVNKSTVPVGTARSVMAALGRPDTVVVSNPEFLREGKAVFDWFNPDRVVIGSYDRAAAERLARLYEPLGAPCLITDPASSETIKYACNAFLAAKLSFVNAVARLCEVVGADVIDVIEGMSLDRRIGANHLSPGPGWGGSCFPKDARALVHIAEASGFDFPLLKEVIASNEAHFEWVAEQVEAAAGGSLDGTKVAVWGLTFKAGTDDLRDSPALAVIHRLRSRGAWVSAFDPTMPDEDDPRLAGIGIPGDPYTPCQEADVLVVFTEWPVFREMDFGKVAAVMAGQIVIDTRNLLVPEEVSAAGLRYWGMGRTTTGGGARV